MESTQDLRASEVSHDTPLALVVQSVQHNDPIVRRFVGTSVTCGMLHVPIGPVRVDDGFHHSNSEDCQAFDLTSTFLLPSGRHVYDEVYFLVVCVRSVHVGEDGPQ